MIDHGIQQTMSVNLRLCVFRESSFVVGISSSLSFLTFLNSVFAASVSLDQTDDDADL